MPKIRDSYLAWNDGSLTGRCLNEHNSHSPPLHWQPLLLNWTLQSHRQTLQSHPFDTANNPGMVPKRYLNTKVVLFCLQQNKDNLVAEMLFGSFSKNVLEARSLMVLTCTGAMVLQQRSFWRSWGLVEERERTPARGWFLACLGYGALSFCPFHFKE